MALSFCDGQVLAAPSNDNFANRLVLSGHSAAATNSNFDATIEPGERIPTKGMAKASLWYEWTAPVDGFVRMIAQGDGFVPVISVYQGSSLNGLKRVVNSLAMRETARVFCSFLATAGSTYVVSVDGLFSDARGTIVFGIDLTTLRIINPLASATISAADPPPFQVNLPQASVDGVLQSVGLLAVQMNGVQWPVGLSTASPFAVVPTNLPLGLITFYALATNTLGEPRVSPPLLVKVRAGNDDFAQRQTLEGYQWEAFGYTAQASREHGEPNHGSASVWWTWTAPSSGEMEIETQLGEEASALRKRKFVVYTGSDVSHLTRVPWTSVIDYPDASKYYHFNAVGGTVYYLVVAAKKPDLDPGTWPFVLRGKLRSVTLVQPTFTDITEPVDVPLAISTTESPSSIQRVEFYATDGFAGAQLIGSVTAPPFTMVWSNAPSGNYMLDARVVRSDLLTSLPSLPKGLTIHPINDNFTNRIVLHTNFATLARRITGGTAEPAEPNHAGWFVTEPSIWWSWTAPADGRLFIGEPEVRNLPPTVAVYSGNALTNLQLVANNLGRLYIPNEVALDTKAGTTYQIAVATESEAAVDLRLRFYTPPVNDDFTNRIAVDGPLAVLEGHTVGATRESGEPDYAGYNLSHSVWWSWNAPGRGYVTLRQSDGTWLLGGVYTGNSLDSLQTILSFGSLLPPAVFEVTAGTTYQIALATYWGDEEHIRVDLDFTPTAMNDQFADRASLAARGPGGDDLVLRLDESVTGQKAVEAVVESKAPGRLADGSFNFYISGPAGSRYVVEYSSNLFDWYVLQTGTLSGPKKNIVDQGCTNAPVRFYRVRSF